MSDRVEEQIRLGLRLLAEDVQPPAETWAPLRPRRELVAVAFCVAVLAAAAVLGLLGRNTGPGSGFVVDGFDYQPGGLSYKAGGVFTGTGGPVRLVEPVQLSAVSAASRDAAWIIGSVAWRWDGTAWEVVPFPKVGMGDLMSVSTVSARDAWATGPTGDGYLLHSRAVIVHWNGTTWSTAQVPGLGPTDLFAISAAGARNVWAGGATYRGNRFGHLIPSATRPLLLHWDGARWRRMPVPWAQPGVVIDRVVATPAGVWAVASGQQEEMPRHLPPSILVEFWNGRRWRSVRAPFGPSDPIAGFGATSGNDAWAVGSYAQGGFPQYHAAYSHSLAAHWDGERWQVARVPDLPGHNDSALVDVVATRPNDAWALGVSQHLTITTDGSGVSIGATQPVALVEHWDGSSWQVMSGGSAQVWSGVGAYDLGLTVAKDGTAWAIGKNWCDNVVLHWDGTVWTVTPHPADRHWVRMMFHGKAWHHPRTLPSCSTSAGG